MAMPDFLPRLLAAREEVVGKEAQLEGVSLRVLGKQRWSRNMQVHGSHKHAPRLCI